MCELLAISILEGIIKLLVICTQILNLHEYYSYKCKLIQEYWLMTHILWVELLMMTCYSTWWKTWQNSEQNKILLSWLTEVVYIKILQQNVSMDKI